jgi:hypothetical protein
MLPSGDITTITYDNILTDTTIYQSASATPPNTIESYIIVPYEEHKLPAIPVQATPTPTPPVPAVPSSHTSKTASDPKTQVEAEIFAAIFMLILIIILVLIVVGAMAIGYVLYFGVQAYIPYLQRQAELAFAEL